MILRHPLHPLQGVDPTRVKTELDDLFHQAGQSNLALLFSLRHDFPTEWSAFAGGAGDFTATIRREHFPYFTQGKPITIVGFELYGQDVKKHHSAGDKDAATSDLAAQGQFTFTAGPDAPGPIQVLTRTAGAQVFLMVSYSL